MATLSLRVDTLPELQGKREKELDTGVGRPPLGAGGETEAGAWLVAWEVGFSKLEKSRLKPCHFLGLKRWASMSLFPQMDINPAVCSCREVRAGLQWPHSPRCDNRTGPYPCRDQALSGHRSASGVCPALTATGHSVGTAGSGILKLLWRLVTD